MKNVLIEGEWELMDENSMPSFYLFTDRKHPNDESRKATFVMSATKLFETSWTNCCHSLEVERVSDELER